MICVFYDVVNCPNCVKNWPILHVSILIVKWIKSGGVVSKRFARAFEAIFVSTLMRDIGLQFPIDLLSLPFFSNEVITACLWEVDNSPMIMYVI